jgi:hypothetical protein
MSAAASGHTLTYTVVAPTQGDLLGIEKGRRMELKERINGNPQPQWSDWYIKDADKLIVAPIRGLHANGDLKVTNARLAKHFVIHDRTIG